MLENLRQQNRLSSVEERQIENKIRIILLIAAAIVIAFVVWTAMNKKSTSPLYYGVMIGLLVFVWIIQDVVGAVWKHALAQRSDEQVSAYLKAAGLDLVGYVGLTWFLLAMNSNSIIGAAIYLFGVTSARRQRDIYYTEPDEKAESDSGNEQSADGDVNALSGDSESSADPASSDDSTPVFLEDLPSSADRELREKNSDDTSAG